PGETAMVGRIVSNVNKNVVGLKVFLYTVAGPNPPPGTPYAYTDGNGDFLYRLPNIKAQLDNAGNVIPITLFVKVFDGAAVATVEGAPPGLRAIERRSLSTAGLVGPAERGGVPGYPLPFTPSGGFVGPVDPPPVLVTSFGESTRQFGNPLPLPDTTDNAYLA